MKKFYILTALILPVFAVNAQNIIQNGDFEAWTTGVPDSWTTIESGITVTQETGTVHGGASAINFDVNTGSQSSTDFRQSVDVVMGKTYDVSVWIYQVDSLSEARLYVETWQDYSDRLLVGQWQEITYQYVAAATASIEVGLRFYDQNGFVDHAFIIADDFTMIENLTAPVIENIVHTPSAPTTSDNVDVNADITDNGTIASAILTWSNDAGTTTNDIAMSVVSGNNYGTDSQIPAQVAGTTVSYFITAVDDNSETTVSAEYSYYIGDFCNGDFEAWTGGVPDCWSTIDAGVTVTEENGTVHGGSAAMHVDVIDGAQANTDIRQFFNAESGVTYDVSVWVYHLDTLSQARLYFKDWQGYSDKLLVDQWQQITYQFTATATEAFEVGLRFYDGAGFVDHSLMIIDDFFIDVASNVNNTIANNEISTYPNPANDFINFDNIDGVDNIQIVDIRGQVVENITVNSDKVSVKTSCLKPGLYIANLRKGNEVISVRFIKK